ncbi:MAG: amidohydrolase [Treponema sp.]|jgi:predicted TIM-barrel fold metal-dependent hydrolase|nr:amidohydrolase [Treponema sp.]
MSKIDFHVHVTPPEISADWRRFAGTEPYFALLSGSKHNRFAAASDVISALDAADFERAVIFGFGFRDMGLCRMVNDYVIEQVRQHPHRLTGFMSVTPNSTEIEKEIDRCQNAGLKGIGELFPSGQCFDIASAACTAALTGICRERGLPLIVHVNEPVGHDYAGKTDTSLRQIERFIEHSPGVKIVLAHWGGGLLFYESMPGLRDKFRDVYYDTAATPFLYGKTIYTAAAALGLTEKILFGSDFPLLPLPRYMEALQSSGLSAGEQDLIVGRNAERLLGF